MDPISFEGRVAVVTGAGGGLGRSYALGLAARGAAVVVNDLDAAGARAVVGEIEAAGGRAAAHVEGVGTRAAGESLIDLAVSRFGRVDVVINNAGNQRNERFERQDDAGFQAVLDVHLNGAFHVTQPAYRAMLAQGYGRVLFTSSASGLFGHYVRANYAAAKAGVVGLMRALAIECEGSGVTTNALLPMAASRLGAAPEGAMKPEWGRKIARILPERGPIDQAMDPDYVAPLALYLVSEACGENGALWSAAAGRYARVAIVVGKGWLAPLGPPPRVEDIAAHMGEIADVSDFDEPLSTVGELATVVAAYRARGG